MLRDGLAGTGYMNTYCGDIMPKNDNIKHPAHYCYSKYEPKDVIREWGLNFNLGSAVKYIARAGRKDDIVHKALCCNISTLRVSLCQRE